MKIKLVIDEQIPYGCDAFCAFGELVPLPGRDITRAALRDADAVIVRSVTRIDRETLAGTRVRFVGTATIGTDHIAVEYLREQGIAFASAAGCNAEAVADYVFAAILRIVNEKGWSLPEITLGVVGIGHIGSRVVRIARALGMRVLQNDPPRQRASGSSNFLPLDALMQADILTLHVPLTRSGLDKTFHLFDRRRLQKLSPGTVLVNSSRGAVVDNAALRQHLQRHPHTSAVLDVWEHEPDIDPDLLQRVHLATPHIAGYSLEGKTNATVMIYRALCQFLGAEPIWHPQLSPVEHAELRINGRASVEAALHQVIRQVYRIEDDDARLRRILQQPAQARAAYFEQLRKVYPARREFSNYRVRVDPPNPNLATALCALRFRVPSAWRTFS